MATTTKVYGLKKPSLTDIYNIMDFNNNFDKIDDVLNTKTEIEDIGTLNGTESVFNTQTSPGFYKGIWNNPSMKQKGDFTLFVFDVSSANTAEGTQETKVMQALFHENQVLIRLGVLGVPVNWSNFSPIATMSNLSNVEQKIGNLSDLATITKTNIVAVINELIPSISNKADKVTNGGFIAGGAEAGGTGNISIGEGIGSTGEYGVVIGSGAEGAKEVVAIGHGATAGASKSIAIGYLTESSAQNAVQICEGSNSESESLQFRKYKIVRYDSTDDRYYLKDVGQLERLYTNNQSSIVDAINELSMDKGNNSSKAVMGEALSKSKEFNIWQNGNWIVGYNISPITITDDTYGTFTLPSQILEISGVKDKTGEEKKYCYASYILNTDNLSGELSASDVTVTYSLKEAKGKPNSYMEIEDETKLTTINIYLGTITLNAENDLLPDGTVSVIYSGSESANENLEINLLKIFNTSGIITGEFVEVTADEVSALF